jgi:hypothetical protein
MLHLQKEYISLYIVRKGESLAVDLEHASKVMPISIGYMMAPPSPEYSKKTIWNWLMDPTRGQVNRKGAKYVVFYRVHSTPIKGFKEVSTKGVLTCKIMGHSLRLWRRQYMAHCKQQEEEPFLLHEDGVQIANPCSSRRRLLGADTDTGVHQDARVALAADDSGSLHQPMQRGEPRWPAPAVGASTVIQESFVNMRYNKQDTIDAIVQKLKTMIGVPLNANDFVNDDDCIPSDFTEGVSSAVLRQQLYRAFNDKDAAVISEVLRCDVDDLMNNINEVSPAYCLVLYVIRWKSITDTICATSTASNANFPAMWYVRGAVFVCMLLLLGVSTDDTRSCCCCCCCLNVSTVLKLCGFVFVLRSASACYVVLHFVVCIVHIDRCDQVGLQTPFGEYLRFGSPVREPSRSLFHEAAASNNRLYHGVRVQFHTARKQGGKMRGGCLLWTFSFLHSRG